MLNTGHNSVADCQVICHKQIDFAASISVVHSSLSLLISNLYALSYFRYSLKQHELSHTETERRYRCDFESCSYAGLTPEALKIHMASHAKGSHGCPHMNCSYVGKSELHLKR